MLELGRGPILKESIRFGQKANWGIKEMWTQGSHEARPPRKRKGSDADSSQRDQGLCKVFRHTVDFAQPESNNLQPCPTDFVVLAS